MGMNELQAFLSEQISGGFGIRELSRQTGVAASTISRIHNGQVQPDIETANKILHPFGYRLAINKIGMESICTHSEPVALTVERLREMGGMPYYHVSLQGNPDEWRILDKHIAAHPEEYYFGEYWIAYDRPPKEHP